MLGKRFSWSGAALAISLFFVLVMSSPIGRPARAAEAVQPARTLDRDALLTLAGSLLDAAPRLAKIWPGYWPPEQPFILYVPGEGALLISTGEKPSSFQPLAAAGIPDRLKGRAFWHGGALPDVRRPFITDYPIGPGKTAILADATRMSEDSIVSLLLHEQFHAYQEHAFKHYAFREFVDPLAIGDRAGFAASAETERRVLLKALGLEAPTARRRLLQQYFALRREREAAMPSDAVKAERALELVEGTAMYVDRTGLALMNGGAAGVTPLLAAQLQKPLASETGAFTAQWFRARSYGTGAAITYLISRLDGGDWRARIQSGASLDELLESRVGKPAPGAAPALAREARASMGYATILRELEPLIRAREKTEIKSAKEFLAEAPYRVILEGEADGKGSAGFSARSMVQLGPETMALPEAQMFNYSAPSVTLSTRNRPVLIEGERYTIVAASAPEIVGLGTPTAGEHRLGSIVVLGEGIELRVDRPVVVSIAEASMTIRLAGR